MRYQLSLGFLQSQISSKENSLANVSSKSNFAGVGILSKYQLRTSLTTDLSVTYLNALNKTDNYNLQPLGLGAGVSYIW